MSISDAGVPVSILELLFDEICRKEVLLLACLIRSRSGLGLPRLDLSDVLRKSGFRLLPGESGV